jgi:acetamidase/formamidase
MMRCSNPALTVKSGDAVRMQTLSTWNPERMEAAGVPVPQCDLDIHAQVKDKGPGGHILTGPVAIEDTEPGDVLEVQILKIKSAAREFHRPPSPLSA